MSNTRATPKKGEWKGDFLKAFDREGLVSLAAKAVGIDRSTAYRARQADEDFALAWADIEEETTERMEREAWRRAVRGVRQPVYQGGKRVGAIRKYSDTLLIFMLKARKPEVYREQLKVVRDDPTRRPAPVEPETIEEMEAAFKSSFAGNVPELDVADMMPSDDPDDGE